MAGLGAEGRESSVHVRLRVPQEDDAIPAHKRVRLSLSSAVFVHSVPQLSFPGATAAQTATPDLFDATPGEATGVAPGRRKSSRSRVYSQCDSDVCKWLSHAPERHCFAVHMTEQVVTLQQPRMENTELQQEPQPIKWCQMLPLHSSVYPLAQV